MWIITGWESGMLNVLSLGTTRRPANLAAPAVPAGK
jgi:hypothetical protein